jgi:membrane-associated phospholipid phosphatase
MVIAPLTPCFAQVSSSALPGASASIAPTPAAATPAATSLSDAAGTSADDASAQERPQLSLPRNTFPQTDTWRTPSRPAVPSLAQIFTETGRDYTRLPSMNTALILGIGAGLAGITHPSDQRLSTSFSGATSTSGFFKPGATLGSTYAQLGAAFAAYGVGRISGNSKMAIVGADLIRVQLLTEGTTQAIKFMAGRTRPNGGSNSFPSGHTASTFATATVLQSHFGWKAGIPAYAFATYVGASRIQMQKHYLSDVAFGAAVGIVAGRTVTVGLGGRRFALAPVAGPNGGIGLGLTRLPK